MFGRKGKRLVVPVTNASGGSKGAAADTDHPTPGTPVVEVALKRQAYGIKPLTDSVIADQQQVADTFFALGLLPKQISAWRRASSGDMPLWILW